MRGNRIWNWRTQPEPEIQELLDPDLDDDMVIIETPVVMDTYPCESMEIESSSRTMATHIHDLPTEVITRIFQFLSPVEDNLPRLGLVCKKWREILKTGSSLWRKLHVDPMCYNWLEFGTLHNILSQYGKHIRTLTWRSNAPVYAPFFRLVWADHKDRQGVALS